MYSKNRLPKNELLKRVGDMSQIAGAHMSIFADGKANGSRAVNVDNGSGLNFTVLPDRGLDIAWARYKGTPISYIGKTGITAPDTRVGSEAKYGFHAGLLYTCGLTNVGGAVEDGGEMLPMHGKYSNLPAENLCVRNYWQDDEYIMSVSGKTTESQLFGQSISLERTITTKLGDNRIYIHDEVENNDFNEAPFMLLYHFNIGYPILDSESEFSTNCTFMRPRDKDAEAGANERCKCSEPVHGYREQVFYYSSADKSYAQLYNPNISLGVRIGFRQAQLKHLMQWKQMGEKEYVIGIEPATWFPEGRVKAREDGGLIMLAPLERRCFDLEVEIIENL